LLLDELFFHFLFLDFFSQQMFQSVREVMRMRSQEQEQRGGGERRYREIEGEGARERDRE
jgi:hypothetical protein